MSRFICSIAVCAAIAMSWVATPAIAASRNWTCPARYVDGDPLPQGWWSARRAEPDRLKAKKSVGALDGLWLVEGNRGEEVAEAPAILAPDDDGWDLTDSTYGHMLVCLYRGREQVLATALPADITHCVGKLQKDASGLLKDGTLSCH